MHFESLVVMIMICATQLSLLQGICSWKLFIFPCFYAESCEAKIFFPIVVAHQG